MRWAEFGEPDNFPGKPGKLNFYNILILIIFSVAADLLVGSRLNLSQTMLP
jgi:hypothetical protein